MDSGLLCNLHHKQIDDQAASFPVDRLKIAKVRHERWVRTSLAQLNGAATSSDVLSRTDDLLIVSPLRQLPTMQEIYKARRESDGAVIEVLAAHAGHVSKNGKFLGDGWGFSITNNTRLSTRINRVLVDVQFTERLTDIELITPVGAGGGTEKQVYWCELFPDVGEYECRYLSDVHDYVKILGNDLEYFEVYFVDRSFENRLYSIQIRIEFTLGAKEQSITLEPILLAFIEDWCTEHTPVR